MLKVTDNMIDKQLRLRGLLFDRLVNKSSKENYLRYVKRVNKLTQPLKGIGARGLESHEEWIPRKDGTTLRVRVYKPKNVKGNVPGVLWLHGGGYSQGLPELYSGRFTRLIEARDCIVVAPDYRLSVEAPYPAALEDAYDTLVWMKHQAKALGIKDNQLMVGGESAGGGLTAALTLYARDKGEVNIAFQMPLYPMLDDRNNTESAIDNDAPIWNTEVNKWAWELYLGEVTGDDVPIYAAPARAIDFRHLPPTVTFVGDIEPFRDETIYYINQLKEAEVPVDFKQLKGGFHGFDIIHPKADISQEALSFFTESFKYAVDHYTAEQNKYTR